jgi:hypothetical protein
MVTFVANAPVNFRAFQLFDAFPDLPSPLMFANPLSAGFDININATTTIHIGGTGFIYLPPIGIPDPRFGTISSISLFSNSVPLVPLYELTGLNIEVSTLISLGGPSGVSFNLPTLDSIFSGNDTITGSNQNDFLFGFGGNDTISGLGGRDTLVGGPGVDTMNGGLGNDSFFVDNPLDVVIDAGPGLDAVHTSTTFSLAPTAPIEVLRVTNSLTTNPVNLTGSSVANPITGNNGANTLTGLGGPDTLSELGGNDSLVAGAGNDRLAGGLGRDMMNGGVGADVFEFRSIFQSRPGATLRDVISAFSHAQHDKIDLRAIDADIDGNPGNQAFRFIGAAGFHGIDGELRFASGILQGDVNGDRRPDFELRVLGVLVAGDILL